MLEDIFLAFFIFSCLIDCNYRSLIQKSNYYKIKLIKLSKFLLSNNRYRDNLKFELLIDDTSKELNRNY